MTTEINSFLDRNGIPRFYYINQVGQTVLLVIEKIKSIDRTEGTSKKKQLKKLIKLILSL